MLEQLEQTKKEIESNISKCVLAESMQRSKDEQARSKAIQSIKELNHPIWHWFKQLIRRIIK